MEKKTPSENSENKEPTTDKPQEKPAEREEWKTVVRPTEKKGRKTVYIAAVVIIIAAFAAGFLIFGAPLTGMVTAPTEPAETTPSESGEIAESGDLVKVRYVGKLESGDVFDTNVASVAKEAGIVRDSHPLLEFTVEGAQVIEGFDEAVLGMKEGEKKTVTIPPEKAYGPSDPELITEIPREQRMNRTEVISLKTEMPSDQFLPIFGMKSVGEVVSIPNSTVEYRVNSITDTSVIIVAEVEKGKSYQFPGTQWSSLVLEIAGDQAAIRHNPVEGKIDTGVGTADIKVTDTEIIITSNPSVGVYVPTAYGYAIITEVGSEFITIDFNHELAGKTLTFDIELIEIIKASTVETTPTETA